MDDVENFSRTWAGRVAADPLAAEVIETLWIRRESFAAPVLQRARSESPVIDAVVAGDFPETLAHVLEHFRALLALPAARAQELGDDPMGFVRRHGVRRAQGGAPLQAVLQAYRTGHKSFWAAMSALIQQLSGDAESGMRAAMLLSEYCIDYTDLISRIVTDAYLEEEAKLAEERTRLGLAVVEDLLGGAAPRMEQGWRLCNELGLADGLPMAVAVARWRGDGDGAFAARALSLLARGVEAALPREGFGRIVGVRGLEVVAVVAAPAAPGERTTRALRDTAASLSAEAGPFRIGVGLDVAAIADLPASFRQALIALELAAGEGVSHLSETGVDDYLRRTADATARQLAPPLPVTLRDGELGRTIEAFAAADLNVKACARRLGVHNNTVYHRLNQVRRMTGADPRTYAGLSTLITALTIARAQPAG